MAKTKMPFSVLLLLVLILSSLIGLACLSLGSRRVKIPQDALIGVEPKSVKVLGHFRLADWTKSAPESGYFTVFDGTLLTGGKEKRVFYNDGSQSIYIGHLSVQFDLPELETILIDIGNERCIIGWITPSIADSKLLYAHFERFEENQVLWMYAQKESTIESNLFIIPITSDDAIFWNSIAKVAIQTKESLQRGFDGVGSYYEIEKTFSPPRDVSNYYIQVVIQP